MSSPQQKPLVLVFGATGRTGKALTTSLLESGNFRVAAAVRPSSVSKPAIVDFVSKGLEIRQGDLTEPDSSKLDELVNGVDIVICATVPFIDQKPIFLAAKRAGVKRVVPSAFGPPVPRGVMSLQDLKLDIVDFLQAQIIPYTVIEVGWWFQGMVPWSHAITNPTGIEQMQNRVIVGGETTGVVCTSLEGIGELTARIIVDDRTLNKTVMTWDKEVNKKEMWKLAEKVTGEDFSDYLRIPVKEIEEGCSSSDVMVKIFSEHMNTLFIRGDCTLEKAKALGALDARELYPDYSPRRSVQEQVEEFYRDVPRYGLEL